MEIIGSAINWLKNWIKTYYQRPKIIPPCYNFISRRQSKTINFFSKWFEKSVYWNEFKSKSENKNSANEYRYSLESNFVEVNTLFISVCWNRRYYLPKGKMKNYKIIINGKSFYDQAIDPDIKQFEEIRK